MRPPNPRERKSPQEARRPPERLDLGIDDFLPSALPLSLLNRHEIREAIGNADCIMGLNISRGEVYPLRGAGVIVDSIANGGAILGNCLTFILDPVADPRAYDRLRAFVAEYTQPPGPWKIVDAP